MHYCIDDSHDYDPQYGWYVKRYLEVKPRNLCANFVDFIKGVQKGLCYVICEHISSY